ncbi:hypothetical protein HJG60_009114 [Phyllostomus discolor]|uniref:Uncharacterized protein n=1 Tax=Phyllostomus discolor TaxID=89673 RepID=A0A833YJP4_9CHIR|nr:hypothetical protein HJG60_009114 [Phyllostomus discolor]
MGQHRAACSRGPCMTQHGQGQRGRRAAHAEASLHSNFTSPSRVRWAPSSPRPSGQPGDPQGELCSSGSHSCKSHPQLRSPLHRVTLQGGGRGNQGRQGQDTFQSTFSVCERREWPVIERRCRRGLAIIGWRWGRGRNVSRAIRALPRGTRGPVRGSSSPSTLHPSPASLKWPLRAGCQLRRPRTQARRHLRAGSPQHRGQDPKGHPAHWRRPRNTLTFHPAPHTGNMFTHII